ncbi:hypothetical protein OLZ32_38660 [Rhizobium sp. 1AS11]|uniref:Transposase n=1 Tax=Rhizobium aouanii TaxID=3118145 RepID=A0ABU8CUR9_9HYPH|nr:hypothetical protein [Rhizobium acaciae]MCW1413754.1 hypothetical protein [Rhizobium acaciae]MCW1746260.1 hypothetical protein [Rhizobium acaciae]MCW1754127.1 hypothetical protein [Rhizobium acaciae]
MPKAHLDALAQAKRKSELTLSPRDDRGVGECRFDILSLRRDTYEEAGLKDLDAAPPPRGRVRHQGGGPRPLTARDPMLLADLERLIEPATLGDPERPLLSVSKSMDKLARALSDMGHTISPNSVRKLLTQLGFSRPFNRKADEGANHPDRDAQLEHINAKVVAAQAAGEPVISVDTKKKELVGNFKNGGSDYRPKGEPQRVNCTTSATRRSAKSSPMASTTWPPTRPGSASGLPPTPPRSPSGRSAPGASAIQTPAN